MTTNNICWLLSAFVLLCAIWSQHAKAEANVYVGAWSKHFIEGEYNEEHRLLAVSHNNWVAGRFDNSYNRETWFAGYDFRWENSFFEWGVLASVSRGYTECFGEDGSNANICAMPMPYIGINDTVAPTFFITHQMVAVAIEIQL